MSSDLAEEVPQVPNWLLKLEEQRAKRLKAKLGHEAGAGAPCQICGSKCPGLDLHFWRKICKICKCGKEDHDVIDEDIYGFVQFTLLGSKPIKTRGVLLKGSNNEVILEFTPKGSSNDVKKYLDELPEDLIPVKGSEAAKLRKQRLQKQMPAHDIDPSLCHALTDEEIKQLEEYVAFIRKHSVGQGSIIRLPIHSGVQHTLNKTNAKLVSNKIPTQIASEENLSNLSNNLQNMTLIHPLTTSNVERHQEQFDNPPPINESTHPHFNNNNGNIGNIGAASGINLQPQQLIEPINDRQVPCFGGFVKDLNYPVNHPQNPPKKMPPILRAESNINPIESPQNITSVGLIHDLNYPSITQERVEKCLEKCHECRETIPEGSVAVSAERTTNLWHSKCFNCHTCKQPLADLLYFYHKDTDNIYCGRDYAILKGIPRCAACDELIFVREYCLAEDSTFHVKHFCCFECDQPLAGKSYLMENNQPLCLDCFDNLKAEMCRGCGRTIRPEEQGVCLQELHWHATDECFVCKKCLKPLLGAKMLLRHETLFCSDYCYKNF